jgi:hypothetical protein
VKKYGFTIEQLGPALARQELDKKAQSLYQDFQILTSAGIDHGLVLEKMSVGINEYVNNALAMGAEVPIAMRPMIEQMIQMGLLTDAAGNRIMDLEGSGISFAMTMSEGFKALIKEVQALTDAISRGLGLAIASIPQPHVTGRVSWDVDAISIEAPEPGDHGFPGFAGGTHGQFLDFGAGTPVMLHGRERVMTESEGRGGGGDTININMAGAFVGAGAEREMEALISKSISKRRTLRAA